MGPKLRACPLSSIIVAGGYCSSERETSHHHDHNGGLVSSEQHCEFHGLLADLVTSTVEMTLPSVFHTRHPLLTMTLTTPDGYRADSHAIVNQTVPYSAVWTSFTGITMSSTLLLLSLEVGGARYE